MIRYCILAVRGCLFCSAIAFFAELTRNAQAAGAIIMDGRFDDWDSVLGSNVKVATSRSNLFVSFTLSNAAVLQESSGVEILFDTDGDPATGAPLHGIGVERRWFAGSRVGHKYTDNTTNAFTTFTHSAIQLKACPVYDSATFEISVLRENTNAPIFSVAVTHNGVLCGVATAPYSDQQPFRNIGAQRHTYADVRAVGYNVRVNRLFQTYYGDTMLAELSTLQPDVICFSEIYNRTAAQTLARVTNSLPYMSHAVGSDDEFIVSRYPITWTNIGYQFVLGRVQSTSAGVDFVACSVHLSCCANPSARASELSGLKSAIQAIRAGSYPVPTNIPIMLIGDLNLVSFDSASFTSFRNELEFTHLHPLQRDSFEDFTWRDYAMPYSDGRLDHALVSQGLVAMKSFVNLSPSPPSDHLPVVVDFAFDSDRDGLSDKWEISHWQNLSATALGDLDGDNMSNLLEQLAGTSPIDPHSDISLAATYDRDAFSLRMPYALNSRWSIWHSIDLISWSRVGLWSENMTALELDEQAASGFYRISSP